MSLELPPSDRPVEDAVAEAEAVLTGVISRHDPSHVFALVSGGTDSLCVARLASRHPRFTACAHVNTEIGVEETREYVRQLCREHGWPLLEYRAPRPPFKDKGGNPWGRPGQTAYEAMVVRWGFPGPQGHTLMYNRLKERCLRQLVRDHQTPGCRLCGKGRRGHGKPPLSADHAFEPRRVVLVTGVRRKESRRRMGHIVAEQVEGRRVWCAPLVEWDDEDKRGYIARERLQVNPVSKRLCISGECLCGAFSKPTELAEITHYYPDTAAYIRRLEAEVKAAGHQRCRWGEKPPVKPRKGKGKASPEQPWLPLCHGCEERARVEEDEEAA
jgi:3'-phosphoadenosine 5'-phosphosulfate sulfotransferase (PAPS reductase)/FAD synthetase